MKRFLILCVIALLTLPAAAQSGVKYVGGTAPGMRPSVMGSLDTTSDTSLVFDYTGNKLAIPYSSIDSFQYTHEVARHLGVLPTIVVALLKVRQHRHFFRISYHDQNHVAQVVILEVPKHVRRTLEALLEARGAKPAALPCRPCAEQN